MYKKGNAFTYLLIKESVANDVINVLLFAGLVFCVLRNAHILVLTREGCTLILGWR